MKKTLVDECVESFKECVMLTIHIKMFITFIDSSIRFGKPDQFYIAFLLSSKANETKLRERLIKKFAEADKLEYYGVKEEFKDSEDFFPYVFVPFYLELPK